MDFCKKYLSQIIICVLILVLSTLFYFQLSSLSNRVQSIEDKLVKDILESMSLVDLSTTSAQDIGNGFYVVRVKAEKSINGVRLSGRIINSKSISYESLTFKVTMLGVSKEFFVNRISAGNSTQFEVTLAGIDDYSKVRVAEIKYQTGTVSYYAT
jgi:hypothetical protein